MQAYAEGFEVMEQSEFDLDLDEIAGIWRYGSVVRSWLLELLHAAFEKDGNELATSRGYVEDSGEGRWTIHEAIAEDVPVPVITAALFARFASRQDESFAAKSRRRCATSSAATRSKKRMTETRRERTRSLEGSSSGARRTRASFVDLRRLRRPDAAQADARAVRARVPPAAARRVRGRRRRADARRPTRSSASAWRRRSRSTRATRSGDDVWDGSPTGCATSRPTSPTTTARTSSRAC